jgi:hypothetical protein
VNGNLLRFLSFGGWCLLRFPFLGKTGIDKAGKRHESDDAQQEAADEGGLTNEVA